MIWLILAILGTLGIVYIGHKAKEMGVVVFVLILYVLLALINSVFITEVFARTEYKPCTVMIGSNKIVSVYEDDTGNVITYNLEKFPVFYNSNIGKYYMRYDVYTVGQNGRYWLCLSTNKEKRKNIVFKPINAL